ncbi:hypothetical protein L6164_013370 [Bauhinia variegata]|uniref:Uncharacterized protein n=1 Tax=Bauhinia variegata TaxID=167791 RepID=A0ACB9NFE4_BAUVA|nr:hypothetical protein L6164_013370 [Bauhinia variegata]
MREKEAKESQADMGSLQHLEALSKIFSPINVEEKGLLYVDLAIEGKTTTTMIYTRATHNFIDAQEAKQLGIKYKQRSGTIKAVNSEVKPIMGIAEAVKVKIGDWQGELDFTIIPMENFKVVLGLEFFCKSYTFLILAVNSLVILDAKTIHVIPLRCMEKAKPMQFKKGLRKDECYVATLRELTNEGNTTYHKESLPSCILEVLDEDRDVMPIKLPKKLPPRREVDHQIELEPSAKPPAMAPYQMAPSELAKLRG